MDKFKTLASTPSSIFFEPVVEPEILDIIRKLDNSKSSGFDNITAIDIKQCAAVIVTEIINLTINSSIYPDHLKVARGKAVYKYESKDDPSIKEVETYKYLGLTIDNSLNWKYHISHVSRKLASCSGVLCKLERFLA